MIKGAAHSTHRRAPYAVEMLVAPASGQQAPRHAAFRPRDLEVRDGMPFLKVQPGEAVAVRIINDAEHDVASTVTLDGLSMFAFRDDKANINEHVIIKQRTSGDVLGWFRNLKTFSPFLVADLPRDHPTSRVSQKPCQDRLDHGDLRRRVGRECKASRRQGRHSSGHGARTRRAIDAPMKPPSDKSGDFARW